MIGLTRTTYTVGLLGSLWAACTYNYLEMSENPECHHAAADNTDNLELNCFLRAALLSWILTAISSLFILPLGHGHCLEHDEIRLISLFITDSHENQSAPSERQG